MKPERPFAVWRRKVRRHVVCRVNFIFKMRRATNADAGRDATVFGLRDSNRLVSDLSMGFGPAALAGPSLGATPREKHANMRIAPNAELAAAFVSQAARRCETGRIGDKTGIEGRSGQIRIEEAWPRITDARPRLCGKRIRLGPAEHDSGHRAARVPSREGGGQREFCQQIADEGEKEEKERR